MSDPTFSVGEPVRWTSQSAGITRTKTGKIADRIPSGMRPKTIRNPGAARDHVSYLVRADNGRLYWPRVAHLEPYDLGGES